MIPKPSRAALTPAALAERLGVYEWQILRAETERILPARDRSKGWSADVADELADIFAAVGGLGRAAFEAAVGQVADGSAYDVARVIQRRLDIEIVYAETIRELRRLGHIAARDLGDGRAVFDGRSVQAFAERPDAAGIVAAAAVTGRTLMVSQVAERMQIRRPDVDHLVRAGWLVPIDWKLTGYGSKRNDPGMDLYRQGDVDELLARTDIDWTEVRATPKGKRSPLAKLPSAETRR